jgi:HAE1 family hydrophobic/amphiphilic exporter-1
MSSSFNSMFLILGAAVFLVYMVMVIQFERFAQPLIVMAAVPFTLIGVVLGLLMFGSTLNVVSLLGMIALSGIVVNNAIVLIDYTNLLRSRGKNLIEAVVEGGKSRLRPIIMTTLTTILGLLPIALGLGEGGKLLSSLGQAIAGGLITSTLITLVLIPVLYSLLEERILKQKEKEGVSP